MAYSISDLEHSQPLAFTGSVPSSTPSITLDTIQRYQVGAMVLFAYVAHGTINDAAKRIVRPYPLDAC